MSFSTFLLDSPASEINISQAANRMSLTLSLFLSLVAYKFALSTSLPPIKYLTHFDKYNLLCFLCLTSQFILHGVCFQFFNGNARALNRGCGALVILTVLGHSYLAYDLVVMLKYGSHGCTNDNKYCLSCPQTSLMSLFTFKERRPATTYQCIGDNFVECVDNEETKNLNESHDDQSSTSVPDLNRENFSTINMSSKRYWGFDNYGQI